MDKNKSGQHIVLPIISLLVVGLAVLDLWAAFMPTGGNWGFHSLAFYGLEVRLIVPLLMLMLIIPAVQEFFIRRVRSVIEWFYSQSRPSRVVLIIAVLVGFVLLFWFFRVKTFFLGDGYLNLRFFLKGVTVGMAYLFQREPLAGFVASQLYHFFVSFGSSAPAEEAYRWMSILSGIGFVLVAWALIRYLSVNRVERILLLVLLLASGASQLFFGYVENYSLAYTGILLFLFFGFAYAQGKISIVWPIAMFGIILTLHFGTLVFLPVLILLISLAVRRKQAIKLVASLIVMSIVCAVLLLICGYTPELLQSVFEKTGGHLMSWSGSITRAQAYTVFTWNHFVDIVNFLILSYPAAVILFIVVLVLFWKKPKPIGIEVWFLLLTALCGLAFIFALNCELGMSRDWDILVPISVGVPIAAVTLWTTIAEDKDIRQRVLVIVGILLLLHSGVFIGVNADEQRAMARFQVLQDENYWSKNAQLNAYDELAFYHAEHHEYHQAVQYYTRYVTLDSTNKLSWKNLAWMHLAVRDTNRAIEVYQTMIRLGMKDSDMLTNFGMLLARQRQFSEGLAILKRAEELAPTSPQIKCNIGVVIAESEKADKKALPYFLAAIRLDTTFAEAYYNAAICCIALGDSVKANQYMSLYMMLAQQASH